MNVQMRVEATCLTSEEVAAGKRVTEEGAYILVHSALT
ncbi:hypothetical protein ACVWZX_000060 [Deinococcus sp. UYEF24]